MYILLVIFFNPQVQSIQAEFNNKSACQEAQTLLRQSRINANTYCMAKGAKDE